MIPPRSRAAKRCSSSGAKGRSFLWQPFSERDRGLYRIERNLFKNLRGNKIVFEEINQDLGLAFRYGWSNSERFGFVRRAWLTNNGPATDVNLLDGLQNLLPCGIGSQFQLEKSTLIDAYKKSELLEESGVGLFMLSSVPIDRPEPAESLRTSLVWSSGLKRSATLLSSRQLDSFRDGHSVQTEIDVRAERGAYFIQSKLRMRQSEVAQWMTVADVNQGPNDVAEIAQLLRRGSRLQELVRADVEQGSANLDRIVGSADGIQCTAQRLRDARHFGNVLFNIMRGGVFVEPIQADDLRAFVKNANHPVAARHASFFRRMDSPKSYSRIVVLAAASRDPQLERICREYLPLTFSRRHGDPSRPWNRFSIATRRPDGSRILNYAGNWRDIFQNWEALAHSFPEYTVGMISKFVNASTADGYNPYRVTRDGIDWEVVEPNDPWSFIGYWGDHQIVYLLKLLEILEEHEPATLRDLLTRRRFSIANVPYRIKPYSSLLKNPKETVIFDADLEQKIEARVKQCGADGKLLWDAKNKIHLATLTEKLLIPVLAKLANFIPEAGIWLNTQRPEWNDANNALVGNGVSMVTLCYLRRHLAFLHKVFATQPVKHFSLSSEVATFFNAVKRVLKKHRSLLKGKIADHDRKRVLDGLGRAGSQYRKAIYSNGFSGESTLIETKSLLEFLGTALEWIDHSIAANRRSDGLYHAYNLVNFNDQQKLPIRRLPEMLEGQVAALSSGCISAEESVRLLRALRQSALYRKDQESFLLYPDRQLPRFTEKNNIPPQWVRRSPLLRKLLADGNSQLVSRDVSGQVHFNPMVTNARDVQRILDQFSGSPYAQLARREATSLLGIFEQLFDHESFTGRSGTFFGYEGLGCIYWHMVSKLLLATQEAYWRAVDSGASQPTRESLAKCYFEIRSGIGDQKTPENYGAFPMDPYSHTPGQGGARQPGLTGQVKEDILCRFGELGVFVKKGQIHFRLRNAAIDLNFLPNPPRSPFTMSPGSNDESVSQPELWRSPTARCRSSIGGRKKTPSRSRKGADRKFDQATWPSTLRPVAEIFHRTGLVERIDVAFD